MSDSRRPSGPAPQKRVNKHSIGDQLGDPYGFVGVVDAIYADYYAARCNGVVSEGWFDSQEKPPSTKDQVFYSLVAQDGEGAVLVGEGEATSMPW